MLCPKCKKTIPMFSKFCPKCGTEAKLTIANKRDWRATKIINWGLILSVLIMITTIVIAVAIKDKSDQEPYRTAFVIVFTICLVVFGLSLLAALIKPLIIKIGSIDEHPAKGSTALFVLVCFIVLLLLWLQGCTFFFNLFFYFFLRPKCLCDPLFPPSHRLSFRFQLRHDQEKDREREERTNTRNVFVQSNSNRFLASWS